MCCGLVGGMRSSSTFIDRVLGSPSGLNLKLVQAVTLLIALQGACAHAGETEFVRSLREVALAYPQTLAAARELNATAREQDAARWQRYPTPSFQGQTPANGQGYQRINTLVVEQPVYAGGRITAGIEAAEAREKAARSRHLQVMEDTSIRIVNIWHEWLRNQARQAVLQDSVVAHGKLKDQIQRRVANGVSPPSDLTLAAARLSQAQTEFAQAQSATRTSHAQLVQLTGTRLAEFTSNVMRSHAADGPSYPPPPQWRQLALERDPQLTRLTAELDALAADIRVKQGQVLPSVSLRFEHDLTSRQQYTGVNSDSRLLLQVNAQPGAGLSALAGIDAAVARREAAIETRRSTVLELEQQLDIDFADHAAALDRLEVAKLLEQSTQDVADSYARQFVAGRKSWLDVLNAVREAVSARLSIHDAQALLGQTWWRLRLRALGLTPEAEASS